MKTNDGSANTKWSIDHAYSEIGFKVRHLIFGHVKGAFKVFDASIYTTAKNFRNAEVDLWIDASSITTGDAKRDKHLKGSDFLNVKKYKRITFTSCSIAKCDTGSNHELCGELTVKGITQMVKLIVQYGGLIKDAWGNERTGYTVTGIINRNDWGLQLNSTIESGELMFSDEVELSCEVELTKKSQNCLALQYEDTFEEFYCNQ